MEPLNVDGVRAIMAHLAGDMTDDDIRVALVRCSLDRWPEASNEEIAARMRQAAEALSRAEILSDDHGLPYWYEEWWGEVSGGAPTSE
jgi:hypothetical protein